MESRKEPGRNRIPGGRKPASPSDASRPARSKNDGFSPNPDRAYVRRKTEGTEGERPARPNKMVSRDYSPRPERDSDSSRERPNRSGNSFSRSPKPGYAGQKSGFNRSDDRPRRSFSDGERRSPAGRPSRPYSATDGDNRSDRPSRFNKPGEDRAGTNRPFPSRSSDDRPFRPKPGFKKPFGSRDSDDRPFRPKPGFKKPFGSGDSDDRPFRPKPGFNKPFGSGDSADRPFRPKPGFNKPFGSGDSADRPFRPKPGFKKPFGERGSEDRGDRPRPYPKREGSDSYNGDRPRPYGNRERPSADRPDRLSFSKKPYGSRNTEDGEKRYSRFSKDADGRPARTTYASSQPRPSNNTEEGTGEEKPKRIYTRQSAEDGESRPERSPRADFKISRPGKTFGHNRKPRPAEGEELGPKGIRLNKYLANAGLCSRREADQFIETGVVEVNGEIITALGHKIQHEDVVLFGGKRVNGDRPTYVLLNKPKDYITTTRDPEQRKTVMELVGSLTRSRVFPVGRLDRNTTGVLMLTNDGDLSERLLHPSRKITKVYQVEVDKRFKIKDLKALKTGIELEDGIIKVDDVSLVEGGTPMQIGIQIHSGRNRIVRRMIEHLGYEIIKLDRVMFAGLTKKGLKRGQARLLTEEEVIMLRRQ
jgi:23S rRNA pseudouridine2605 synthase